jgi:hypothetical protein
MSIVLPNESLDFHLEDYASVIHAVQRQFVRWKHKAGVLVRMQCTSLNTSE